MPTRSSILALLLAASTAGAAAPALAEGLPAEREALILTRAVAYDRALPKRAGDKIVLAVLHDPDRTPSDESRAALAAFRKLQGVRVAGLPFEVVEIAGTAEIDADLRRLDVDLVYVCSGVKDLPAVKRATQARKIVSIGALRSQVEAGLSLGVTARKGQPQLVVNLAASRAEGAEFGSGMLRLADVIR